eukprot:m.100077 g.100077  ORF g.100077 m.100077 type:complete len:543 (-) comp12478_c0_seq1:57-1685(-)
MHRWATVLTRVRPIESCRAAPLSAAEARLCSSPHNPCDPNVGTQYGANLSNALNSRGARWTHDHNGRGDGMGAEDTLAKGGAAPFTDAEIADLRAATPSCNNFLHLNAAGASPPPAPVMQIHTGHLHREAEIGGYAAADEVQEEIGRVYTSLARLLSAKPNEIALVDSCTTAYAKVMYGIELSRNDVIMSVGESEYAANLVAMHQHAKRHGARVRHVAAASSGEVDMERLESALKEEGDRVKAVSITHIPTRGDIVYDVKRAIETIHTTNGTADNGGPVVLVDACQSVGQMEVSVADLDCDALVGTSRKWLRGPRGVGFLYVGEAVLGGAAGHAIKEPGSLDHFGAPWQIESTHSYTPRSDARRYEYWENAVASQLAFGAAVDYALAIGIGRIERRVAFLASQLRRKLDEIGLCVDINDGIEGILSPHRVGQTRPVGMCGVVTVGLDGAGGADGAFRAAREKKIGLSVTGPPGTPLDFGRMGSADPFLRISPHYFNTEAELGSLCAFLNAHAEGTNCTRIIPTKQVKSCCVGSKKRLSQGAA